MATAERGAGVRPWLGVLVVVLLAAPGVSAQEQGAPETEAQAVRARPAGLSTGQEASGTDRPFRDLFRHLRTDLTNLAVPDTSIVLSAGTVAALATYHADQSTTATLNGSSAADFTLEAGEVIGGGMFQVGGALTTYVIGRALRHDKTIQVGSDLVRAQLLNALLTQGIKMTAGRTRPDGGRRSFPSGHASSTFASATVLQRHFGWRVGLPAYGVAAYVATSRLAENRHFLTDVIVGAAVGIVSGRAVTFGRRGHRFALSPLVTPGGAGVAVVAVSAGS